MICALNKKPPSSNITSFTKPSSAPAEVSLSISLLIVIVVRHLCPVNSIISTLGFEEGASFDSATIEETAPPKRLPSWRVVSAMPGSLSPANGPSSSITLHSGAMLLPAYIEATRPGANCSGTIKPPELGSTSLAARSRSSRESSPRPSCADRSARRYSAKLENLAFCIEPSDQFMD